LKAEDLELITRDSQIIGLLVTGDIFRPQYADRATLRTNWVQYRVFYLDDEALQTRINSFAFQAMKVCVGERTFDDAVIGEGRDELRMCIDQNMNEMSSALGVVVKNVAVPNVIISDDVRKGLDAIVQSRLAAQKAEQDLKTAEAEGEAKVALAEADVKAEQAKILEQAKQKTTLAALEVDRLKAEQDQIRIQIENEQLLIELADLKAQEAYLQAQTNLASELVLADTFTENPELYLYKMALANASALTETDKIIFTTEGNMPNIIFSSSGVLPTIPTDGDTTTP
jgi:regulator of protease activity HflC (stomatin/prohibitin superfamily)